MDAIPGGGEEGQNLSQALDIDAIDAKAAGSPPVGVTETQETGRHTGESTNDCSV